MSADAVRAASFPVLTCPLCNSPHAKRVADALPNLYSEKLAELLHVSESALLSLLSNVQCLSCGLIYKSRWLQPDLLKQLFQGAVALHPKGWDAISGRFSTNSLRYELQTLHAACLAQDRPRIARHQRASRSILESIIDYSSSKHVAELLDRIDRAAIDPNLLIDCEPAITQLAPNLIEPAPFKRFSGFASKPLWAWLEEQLGDIKNYAELGCPLWGFLPSSAASNTTKTYLSRNEHNYWGAGCTQNALPCVQAMQQRAEVKVCAWEAKPPQTFDLLGMFQYLDHVEAPLQLMQQALFLSHAVALVLDETHQPCAVQHVSAWPPLAVHYIAKRCNAQVISGFTPIQDSGNELFLLRRVA